MALAIVPLLVPPGKEATGPDEPVREEISSAANFGDQSSYIPVRLGAHAAACVRRGQ